MAKQGKVTWRMFGSNDATTWLVIDDRMEGVQDSDLELECNSSSGQLTHKRWWKNVKWAPMALIPVDGRFTPDELKKRAQVICDTLNAQWVKDEIEGKE